MENRKFGNITLIEGKHNGKYPFCHTLLIEGSVRVLVDPACGRSKMTAVREEGRADVIVATHFHEDHLTYNYLFPEAEIYIHRADAPAIRSVEGFFAHGLDMPAELRGEWANILDERFHFLGWEPARLLEDGDELLFGNTRAVVVHTPGHTPGHICLHFPDHELVYLADIDLSRFGPWYGNRLSDIDETIRSVNKVKEIKAKWFVPSHEGPVFEDIAEPAAAYLKIIEDREERILKNIKQPISIDELADKWVIYRKPRHPVEFFQPSEKGMLAKHLDRLVRDGKAAVEDGKYVAL